jgi:flagellar hook-length control protein FliK
MNAVPPVLQAQPSSGPVHPNESDPASSATPRAGSQDFAAALSDAGGKPARKNTANKHQDSSVSGSSLPPPGNQPPPVQNSLPPAKSAAGAVADAPVAVKGSPGSAQGTLPNGTAAATQPNPTDSKTILTAENLDTAAPPASAVLPMPASAVPPAPAALPELAAPASLAAGVDATTPSAANAPPVPASGPTMPHANSTRILATPGMSKASTVPAAVAGNPAKSGDAIASPGTTGSSDSTLSSADAGALNDSTLSTGPAATGTDAAAQAVMAAAIAQGTNAPAPVSTFTDDLAAADGDLPSGAAAVSGPAAGAAAGAPAAGASVAALVQASAAAVSAAAAAATAASVAQAVSATVGNLAADKRSHGNSSDSTLPGASNDGSVGAAQILTSNSPTDSVPMPTFKVAAGVDTAQFGQGVADHVSLMMDGNLTSAKLQVNPPALGPIEVRIALQGGHAQVSFSSHSAVTRDALESSSEKLREMLGSQGFSSVSVDISQRSFQERSPPSQAYESAPSIGAGAPVQTQVPLSISRSASGLLDAYA